MMTDRDDLLAARRSEAVALLEANQTGRARASAVLLLGAALVFGDVLAAVALRRSTVVIPAGPALLLVLSIAFQQFADVSVLGATRKHLEQLVNRELGEPALVYELCVADIRKRAPLVISVRVLQIVYALGALGAVVAALVFAFGQSAWLGAVLCLATATTGVSAGLSYRDMLRAGQVAEQRLMISFSEAAGPAERD